MEECGCEHCGQNEKTKRRIEGRNPGGRGRDTIAPAELHTPKPMVPVLNLPFLEHVIRNLKEHNITEIVMAQFTCRPR